MTNPFASALSWLLGESHRDPRASAAATPEMARVTPSTSAARSAPAAWSPPTRQTLPLVLIRGFGGLSVDEARKVAYQGFNEGTVYPQKRGENYIYEGLVLRFLKSTWAYQDATNVVGYYASPITDVVTADTLPPELRGLDPGFFFGSKIVIDVAMASYLLRTVTQPTQTLWVFRYYDLDDRKLVVYGEALTRLIDFVRALAAHQGMTPAPKVNIIAHSLGGLVVREAIQANYPARLRDWQKNGRVGPQPASADDSINKVVTLGTPHQGIAFDIIKHWIGQAADELNHFDPEFQKDATNPESYIHLADHFPLDRFLTVVGTNYHTYGVGEAVLLNRLFSIAGEFGMNYNRSDGLVKQSAAQIPGAPRTFIHKCHGGNDSLVTSREAFEVATRFFFGNIRARLRLVSGQITRGMDLIGKSEFFFGVSIKPRGVDFELFHQDAAAENCYGPFSTTDLTDASVAFDWAGERRLIWEGSLDVRSILADPNKPVKDLVLRLDVYVGERDLLGLGFSDNAVFRQQCYVQALLEPTLQMFLYPDEQFARTPVGAGTPMSAIDNGFEFDIGGPGFSGRLRIELDLVPETGAPVPYPTQAAVSTAQGTA
jgi:triacylglycerol esterase/lipase EstA (alpha/beta hydrolase family)